MTDQNRHNYSQDVSQAEALDRLFVQGRAEQPKFDDHNFTKMVCNRLPAQPHRVRNRKYLPDIIGLVFGLLVTYLVLEPSQLTVKYFSLLPNNISISLANMLIVSVAFSILALFAWWTVENNQPV